MVCIGSSRLGTTVLTRLEFLFILRSVIEPATLQDIWLSWPTPLQGFASIHTGLMQIACRGKAVVVQRH
jgi:hypothetical protein